MSSLILKLILAHIIGDFLLQPSSWVQQKLIKKHASPYLYLHIGVHAVAMVILIGFKHWAALGIILSSHLIIDIIKIRLNSKFNKKWLFIADQAAHIAMIALAVYIYFPYKINYELALGNHSLLVCIHLIFITSVSSILISLIITKWDIRDLADPNDSLEKAGLYIGILERLFVFGFIITNHWEGIGFLIAAKSVFRFGDLNNAKNKKLTEYVLIGTLLSFGFAILAGLSYKFILPLIK